jgi:hypothetical protein
MVFFRSLLVSFALVLGLNTLADTLDPFVARGSEGGDPQEQDSNGKG